MIAGIRAVLDRSFKGRIKTITISRTPTRKYYASVLVDTGEALPAKPAVRPETSIGIDLGVLNLVTLSDQRKFEPCQYLKRSLKLLQCLQRRVSRKKKGSQNRKKAQMRVARLHERICNQRINHCHQITTLHISDSQAETWVIEDLAVANMQKNHHLARALQDVSFGEVIRQLRYKCNWYGKNLIQIGRFEPTSKSCSVCEGINYTLTLSDRQWTCERCAAVHDRDINAARRIKQIGLEKYTGARSPGEPVELRRLRRAKKQELCVLDT